MDTEDAAEHQDWPATYPIHEVSYTFWQVTQAKKIVWSGLKNIDYV